jgi:hypothetical protein
MPVEIVPCTCPEAPGGKAYLLSAYPMSKTAGPCDIALTITSRLGTVFDSEGDYVPFEVSHEIDAAGMHKVSSMHRCLDPTLNLVRLAW